MSLDNQELNRDLGALQAQMADIQQDFKDHLVTNREELGKIHGRLDDIHRQLAELHGARKLMVWLLAFVASGVAFFKGWFDPRS